MVQCRRRGHEVLLEPPQKLLGRGHGCRRTRELFPGPAGGPEHGPDREFDHAARLPHELDRRRVGLGPDLRKPADDPVHREKAQRLLQAESLGRPQGRGIAPQLVQREFGPADQGGRTLEDVGEHGGVQVKAQLRQVDRPQGLREGQGPGPDRAQGHRGVAGRDAVVLVGTENPEHVTVSRVAVYVAADGHGMLRHLLCGEAGVAAVDQETLAPADPGQHPGDEVGVVAVVVVGVGENVDQDVGRLQGALRAVPVGVATARARVEIGGVQQDHVGGRGAADDVQRPPGFQQVPGVLERHRRFPEGLDQRGDALPTGTPAPAGSKTARGGSCPPARRWAHAGRP